MSEEMNKKLFAHYTAVAGGSVKSGNSVRNESVVSDAKKHLADLVKKNPGLLVVEDPKEEVKEEPKETKPKKVK